MKTHIYKRLKPFLSVIVRRNVFAKFVGILSLICIVPCIIGCLYNFFILIYEINFNGNHPSDVKAKITTIDNMGNYISGVNYIQIASFTASMFTPAKKLEKDWSTMNISCFSENNKTINYSTKLFFPEYSYLVFFKSGYYPTKIPVNRLGNTVILVSKKSVCQDTHGMTRNVMEDDLFFSLPWDYWKEFSKGSNGCAVDKIKNIYKLVKHIYNNNSFYYTLE